MIFTQSYVASMCEAVDKMKLTDRQKEFMRAGLRAAIEFANAKHGMHASKEAMSAAVGTLKTEEKV